MGCLNSVGLVEEDFYILWPRWLGFSSETVMELLGVGWGSFYFLYEQTEIIKWLSTDPRLKLFGI